MMPQNNSIESQVITGGRKVNPPFILNAISLGRYQTCRRRHLLEADWRVVRWQPKALYDSLLRQAVMLLASKPADHADRAVCVDLATDAKAQFLQLAANPGLDTDSPDPYRLAKEYCALIDTTFSWLARQQHPPIQFADPVDLSLSLRWRVLNPVDPAARTLHRWITVDHWNADVDLPAEMHSWRTIGDMAVTNLPLTLHVIVIGQMRKGHRASPWTRTYRHPGLPHLKYRFLARGGRKLKDWLPTHLSELPADTISSAEWLDLMERDGVLAPLIHHYPLRQLSAPIASDIRLQIMQEALRMRDAIVDRHSLSWSALPMSREQCDAGPGHSACPFQWCCHSPNIEPVDPATVGLYQSRRFVPNVDDSTSQPTESMVGKEER